LKKSLDKKSKLEHNIVMSKDKKSYSIIEGCIRQSMKLPLNKDKAKDKETRVYVDENMYLSSPFKNDHDFMDKKEKDEYRNQKMPWEDKDD
tara:strand:+ start:605 stop:877 length:273 start_codon:yes stop_codon:yes gene_type:complete